MGKVKKNWRSAGRQFAYIMGNADQSPLGFVLLKASQVESSKAHVVFHISESAFGLDTTLLSQGNTLFGEQVLCGLSAVFPELEADLDAAVAFGFGALRFERTGSTLGAFIITSLG